MKKLILSVAVLAMLSAALGPAAAAQSQQEAPSAYSMPFIHGSVPAQAAPAQAMRPALHALTLAMLENDLAFDPQDEDFLWTSLYYMLGMYGQQDQRAVLTDDTLILPPEVISDYAAALYPQVTELPEIPQSIADRMAYSAQDNTYHLARGDAGLAEVAVRSAETQADGTLALSGSLVYPVDGSSLASFQAVLQPTDTMFGYVITDMTLTQ